jgi:hypothetical protein
MKNTSYISHKTIRFFENYYDELDYPKELLTKLCELNFVETIRQMKTLGSSYRYILAETIGLSIMQLDAIIQIYCSDLIEKEIRKGLYTCPTIISNNIMIDVSKQRGVLIKDGDKYTLSDKPACKKCTNSKNCKKHSGFAVCSSGYIAKNLQLEVFELEVALELCEEIV